MSKKVKKVKKVEILLPLEKIELRRWCVEKSIAINKELTHFCESDATRIYNWVTE